MASKAESTLSRRCKNFEAVQGSAHEIMWCYQTLWGIQYVLIGKFPDDPEMMQQDTHLDVRDSYTHRESL